MRSSGCALPGNHLPRSGERQRAARRDARTSLKATHAFPPVRSASGTLAVYPPSLNATVYSAEVSIPSSSVSTRTPCHAVSSFDHFVTQWMSAVISSVGSARNSSQVQRRGSSTSPATVKSHRSNGVCGVGPADRTGKSLVRYWPGGSRPGGASPRRPRKPREMIGGISPTHSRYRDVLYARAEGWAIVIPMAWGQPPVALLTGAAASSRLLVKGVNLIGGGVICWVFERAQGDSGATPNPTANLRHQMTALLNADRSVPAGMT